MNRTTKSDNLRYGTPGYRMNSYYKLEFKILFYFQNKLQSFLSTTIPTGIKTNKIITIIINVKTIAPSKHLSAISYFSSIDSVTLVLYFSSHAFK
mgnify:CR=1 FL=1